MLTESMEDYLEIIFRLIQEKGYVRAVDIAEAIRVQPSSVTRMIQKLDEEGYIHYQKYRNIALSDKGRRLGYFLVWRDAMLKEFFTLFEIKIGIEEQVEGIEHYITPATMCLFRDLVLFFRTYPEQMEKLRQISQANSYPEGEQLQELRAWLFRHSNDE
ncbi:MAG: transcriptional regulator MntR [Clostridia bacterium]|nr:transcriptional regulator MntR [Clostridia bacterium]